MTSVWRRFNSSLLSLYTRAARVPAPLHLQDECDIGSVPTKDWVRLSSKKKILSSMNSVAKFPSCALHGLAL